MRSSKKTLGVVGLGYVGLPLAVQAASKGYSVIGVDINAKLVRLVNARQSPYVNDERFTTALAAIKDGLEATSSFADLRKVDNIVICVPTPTNNNIPDLEFVKKSTEQVAKNMRAGQLIVIESTVSPGITRDVVLPIIERISGLKVGVDFNLAHCPERIDPGNETFFVGNLNRVVGGITEACTRRAVKFYRTIVDAKIIALGTTEEAEFVKSWENSHRNIMIALANSAAIICDGLDMDISRVLLGLQSKIDQFGLHLAQPGIGTGGHCIPEDIHYVIKKARQNGLDTRFLDDSAELNDKMPHYAVHKLKEIVKDNGDRLHNLRVALLGLAYKPNVADMRRSPSIEVGYLLVRHAKSTIVHDPYIGDGDVVIKGTSQTGSLEQALRKADVVFIGTAHNEYLQSLDIDQLNKFGIKYVFDGRNILDKAQFAGSNIVYKGIGK